MPNPDSLRSIGKEAPPPSKPKLEGPKPVKTAQEFGLLVGRLAPLSEQGKPIPVAVTTAKKPELTTEGHVLAAQMYEQIKTGANGADYVALLKQLRGIRSELTELHREVAKIGYAKTDVLTQDMVANTLLLNEIEALHLGNEVQQYKGKPWELYKALINQTKAQVETGIEETAYDALSEKFDQLDHYAQLTNDEPLKNTLEKSSAAKFYAERTLKVYEMEGEARSSWHTIRDQLATTSKLPKDFLTYQMASVVVSVENTLLAEMKNRQGESFDLPKARQALELALFRSLPQENLTPNQMLQSGESTKQYIQRLTGIAEVNGKRVISNDAIVTQATEMQTLAEQRLKVVSATEVTQATEAVEQKQGARLLERIRNTFSAENIKNLIGRETWQAKWQQLQQIDKGRATVWALNASRTMVGLVSPLTLMHTDQFPHPQDVGQLIPDLLHGGLNFGQLLNDLPHQAQALLDAAHHNAGQTIDPTVHFLTEQATNSQHMAELSTLPEGLTGPMEQHELHPNLSHATSPQPPISPEHHTAVAEQQPQDNQEHKPLEDRKGTVDTQDEITQMRKERLEAAREARTALKPTPQPETPPQPKPTSEKPYTYEEDKRTFVVNVDALPQNLKSVLEADGSTVSHRNGKTVIEIGAQEGQNLCVASSIYTMVESLIGDNDIPDGFTGYLKDLHVTQGGTLGKWENTLNQTAQHYGLHAQTYDISRFANPNTNPDDFVNFIKNTPGKMTIMVLDGYMKDGTPQYHAGVILGFETDAKGQKSILLSDGNASSAYYFQSTWTEVIKDSHTGKFIKGEVLGTNPSPGILEFKLKPDFFGRLLEHQSFTLSK